MLNKSQRVNHVDVYYVYCIHLQMDMDADAHTQLMMLMMEVYIDRYTHRHRYTNGTNGTNAIKFRSESLRALEVSKWSVNIWPLV